MKLLPRLAALAICLGVAPLSWAKPVVLTSMHPLSLISAAIVGENAEIVPLLPPSEEPHHYSLRIGDKLALQKADLVVWIGPGMEGFLTRAIGDLDPAKVLTASTLPDIQLQNAQGNNETIEDFHLWLNPEYAIVIATELANWLAAHQPQQAPGLLARLQRFSTQTRAVSHTIAENLNVLQSRKILVDHDAFGYFFSYFGIQQAGALKSSSGLAKGARALASTLNESNFDCVVAEPRSHHNRVARVAARRAVPTVVIDPLGAHLSPSENSYTDLLLSITQALLKCGPEINTQPKQSIKEK